jgi:hypothetical protein
MSRGENLQEMEVGTTQSKTAVNAGAKAADPMQKLAPGAVAGQTGSWEDLGGPTPDNYKSDDDSAKLKTPGATLKQVKDVVTKGAKAADAMPAGMKEESETEEEVIEEGEEFETETNSILRKKVQEALKVSEETETEDDEEEEEVEAEAEETVEAEYDVEEDVNALLQGEELSEEFQEKAKMIFESAINAKVAQIREELEADYVTALQEEISEMKIQLVERVDSYLEYVADEWLQENVLAVEQGLKTEMTESFLSGMKDLFEAHYVSIPEDKYDVLESMVNKLDDMETKLNEQIERNVALNKRLAESVTDGIFGEVSEGLAITQKEKLASLAESVEFESEADYREKLVSLKEAYFPSKVVGTQRDNSEFIAESNSSFDQQVSGSMSNYLTALQRVTKK